MTSAEKRKHLDCYYVDQKPEELSLALFNCNICQSNFTVYNSSVYSFENIILNAYIIGESHIVTLCDKDDSSEQGITSDNLSFCNKDNFVFSEILACTDLSKISTKPLLSLFDPSANTACYTNKKCDYRVEVLRHDFQDRELFSAEFNKCRAKMAFDEKKRQTLNYIFPEMQFSIMDKPKTKTLFHEKDKKRELGKTKDVLSETLLSFDFSHSDEKSFSWETLHAYPSCRSFVITKTGLKIK